MRALWVALFLAVVSGEVAGQAPRRTPPRPPGGKIAPADVKCPSVLGIGVDSRRTFCDVLTGREPLEGVLVEIPAHTGTATLSFDLHNRHTYSDEEIRAGQGYAAYTTTIGILTPDGKLLARGVAQAEFRTAADLLERVGGGAGPSGIKAVAPVGTERISVSIPTGVTQVSVLGESLIVLRRDGGKDVFTSPGRPIAIISNAEVEYRPAPVRRR